MAKRRQNVIKSDAGLLDKTVWRRRLEDYPTDLFLQIQSLLKANVKDLTEKFNHKSRYFGYCKAGHSDVLYIYIQKKRLRIDLKIDQDYEKALRRAGYTVKYVNNYQGRFGWVTGWFISQDCRKVKEIVNYMLKAFK